VRRSPKSSPPNEDQPAPAEYTHIWRVRTRLGDRFGTRCKVLSRGGMNSILVEFSDGLRVVTSRFYVRRVKQT
jgi:hypothetical protein